MGREPCLSVFFWYFSLRQTDKVGWASLSSRPRRKLMKSYCESYKRFMDHFFRVAAGRKGPSYSIKDIALMKACSWSTTPAVVADASPLSTVGSIETTTSVVMEDSIEGSLLPTMEKATYRWGEALHTEERPSKRVAEEVAGDGANLASRPAPVTTGLEEEDKA
ncbi:hypothetical protein CR513_57309, partial [Mucuna pruriens]